MQLVFWSRLRVLPSPTLPYQYRYRSDLRRENRLLRRLFRCGKANRSTLGDFGVVAAVPTRPLDQRPETGPRRALPGAGNAPQKNRHSHSSTTSVPGRPRQRTALSVPAGPNL